MLTDSCKDAHRGDLSYYHFFKFAFLCKSHTLPNICMAVKGHECPPRQLTVSLERLNKAAAPTETRVCVGNTNLLEATA